MVIRKVSIDNKSDLEFIERLYIESFPPDERRPVLEMHHLMEDNNKFNVCILTDGNDTRIGFINYWVFEQFVFLEHFAISPEQRSEGYGRKAIEAFISETTLPIVGEIEFPETSEFALRRLNFYKNLNFTLWNDIPYEQPSYVEGYNPIPMLLLTYRDFDLNNNIEFVRNQIYKEVYQVKMM